MENRNYSKGGDDGILLQIQKERVICDGNLSPCEIIILREKLRPWIESGIIGKIEGTNPENPPELEFRYSLTELGKERLSEFEYYGF